MPKSIIKFKSIFHPVDVIIPFFSCYHLLSECLESLIAKTLGVFYTITLVDDCSPNKNFIANLEKRKVPIQYLRHDKQEGFGAALQSGFNNTHNDWVVFLHADCRIERADWLINMLKTMQDNKDKGVKLVSARMNDGGTGAFDENVIGSQDTDLIAEQPLPLVCALTHRNLFNNIGGFIKHYYPFGGEDLELFWRMKLYNLKQMICGKSYVHHVGGGTINNVFKGHETQKIFDDNEKLFSSDIRELHSKIKIN